MLNCMCNDGVEHCGDGLSDGTAGLRMWLYCIAVVRIMPPCGDDALWQTLVCYRTTNRATKKHVFLAEFPVPVCPALHFTHRADWEPEATSGKCMAGVPGVFWRSPAVLWGPSTHNPALVAGKPLILKNWPIFPTCMWKWGGSAPSGQACLW